MGSWNASAFGNDAAADWLAELMESNGWSMVDEAVSAVLGAGDEAIDEQSGAEAVAAAEVVAWVLGQPGADDDDSEGLEDWIGEQEFEPDAARARKAKRAVDRVFNEPSELREIWEDSGEFDDWRKALTDLKDRLGSA